MTPSQSSVTRTLAVGYDSPISAASLSAQLPTGLGAGNAVAGRSADATKESLLRARTLERSVGHDLGAEAITAVLRGVQPLSDVVDAVYAGVCTWLDNEVPPSQIIPESLRQHAQHFLLSIVCTGIDSDAPAI